VTLANVQPDDIVLCDIRGQQFYAIAKSKIEGKRELEVEPIDKRNGPVRIVKSNQVKTRYRRCKS
jgi:hypothetical protein